MQFLQVAEPQLCVPGYLFLTQPTPTPIRRQAGVFIFPQTPAPMIPTCPGYLGGAPSVRTKNLQLAPPGPGSLNTSPSRRPAEVAARQTLDDTDFHNQSKTDILHPYPPDRAQAVRAQGTRGFSDPLPHLFTSSPLLGSDLPPKERANARITSSNPNSWTTSPGCNLSRVAHRLDIRTAGGKSGR